MAPLMPAAKPGGLPRSVEMRLILNGLFSALRTGCPWRYLPREYGPWPTVYYYFRRWRLDGTWSQIHAQVREVARLHAGHDPTPSAAIIDSQSVKIQAGGVRGTSWSILKAGCFRRSSIPLRSPIAKRDGSC